MPAHPTRRGPLGILGALVATGVFATVSVGVLSTAAGGIGEDLLATTTTTLLDDGLGAVTGAVDDLTSSTTRSTTTTSTTTTTTAPTTTTMAAPTTTTTTAPAAPPTTVVTSTKTNGPPRTATGAASVPPGEPSVPGIAPAAAGAASEIGAVELPRLRPAPGQSILAVDGPAAAAAPAGGRSTRAVLEMLGGLDLPPSVIARILAPFPVAGAAHYSDDWQAIRTRPALHLHEGTDIFAPRGTPVIASGAGVVSRLVEDSPIGGNALRLTTTGGTYFYYSHLDGFAPGLAQGDQVRRGDVLGFVGSTGNAEGTAPHLHYEIHPAGGEPVNPVPYLDRWLVEAELSARSVQGSPAAAQLSVGPRTEVAAGAPAKALAGAGGASGGLPAAVELGPLQPVSSVAAGPLGLLGLMAGARFGWKRAMRRRRARARRVA